MSTFALPNFQLETPRLWLRPVEKAHLPHIFAYAKDPRVSEFTMWEPHRSLEETQSYYSDYILPNYAAGVPEPLGLFLKDRPDQLIGMVGAYCTSESHGTWELAYLVRPENWGQGLVAEASKALMHWCFERFEINRFQCRCKSPNHGSRRVMEKIGFIYEGALQHSLIHRDRPWTMLMFSLTAQQWFDRQGPQTRTRRLLVWERTNIDPRDAVWVAESEGQITASLGLRESDDQVHGEYSFLTGDRTHWPKLYELAHDYARLEHFQHITVARDLFLGEESFFSKRGFCPTQFSLELGASTKNR